MRRFAWFDCLRCLAICLVILAHAGKYGHVLPGFLVRPFGDLQLISWVGVDLFFVLSGFLVSGLLFDEHDETGRIDIRRFLIRRAFKIIPPFYFLILVTALHDGFSGVGIGGAHLFHDLFFIQNYRIGAWGYTWTLAVEVHFYILLGLLLHFLSKRATGTRGWLARLPVVICFVLAGCFLARLINSGVRTDAFNAHREFWPSHLHLDVLAAGVLLRYLYTYQRARLALFARRTPLWIGLALLLIFPSEYLWLPHPAVVTALIPTGNYLGFALVLFTATRLPFPASGWKWRVVQPFDYLGKHSYSIYLWHLPVKMWLVTPLVKVAGLEYFLFFTLASLAVGTFFSVVLEMPVLALRNRLFPSSSRSEARSAAPVQELRPLN